MRSLETHEILMFLIQYHSSVTVVYMTLIFQIVIFAIFIKIINRNI